ncbi:CHAT domain-containing protein [Ephemerocybe angulata]|uniref:CHAT domain-containing protein n=1 Tax=Ephemerocybe angulata TaxID=980116 RepID=A0A8H6M0X3_9AGAR|nr:CHAT domain-containing protein [Tulosesus angulatus]
MDLSCLIEALRTEFAGDDSLALETANDILGAMSEQALISIRSFEKTGDLSDLDDAISTYETAVHHTLTGDESLHVRLSDLGSAFLLRFQHGGNIPDISEAISLYRRALQTMRPGHLNLSSVLSNLGTSLFSRSKRINSLQDISESITLLQRAASLVDHSHETHPVIVNNLGNSFLARFQLTGHPEDMHKSISSLQSAVDLTPPNHLDLSSRLNDLGNSFQVRFRSDGKLDDVEEAIRAQRRAVQLTQVGDIWLPSRLSNLGNSLSLRFGHNGDLADIAEAISVQQRAVHITPKHHPMLHGWLSNLAISLTRRFERTQDRPDIDGSISALEGAVKHAPKDHANLPHILTNLSIALMRRFKLIGNAADLSAAVSNARKAVDLTPEGHEYLSSRLDNLGNILTLRFDQTGDPQDISQAIISQQKAIKLTPKGHSALPAQFNNLGNAFQSRFNRTNELSDIAEAILAHQRAVQLTPKGHYDLPRWLRSLADSFYWRCLKTGHRDDLFGCISNFKSSATCTFGPPQIRLLAAKHWARLSCIYPLPFQAFETLVAFDTAIGLVALIVGLDQTVRYRYDKLKEMSDLPLEAASNACRLSRPDKSLEWLEQGRCLVWGQLSTLRTPFGDLRKHDNHLAQSILEVSQQLENAGSSRGPLHSGMTLEENISAEDEARSHLKLARRWDELLQAARAIPGFGAFLKPLPCSALLHDLPSSGYVVVINIDKKRCDAIALIPGKPAPFHIPLPQFSLEKATKCRADLSAQLQVYQLRDRGREAIAPANEKVLERGIGPVSKGKRGNNSVRSVLQCLWEQVVKPILDALGISKGTQAPTSLLLRVWWCPTGPLSFLPIHAAGIYGAQDSQCLPHYVISSYTPSVSALSEIVRNSTSTKNPFSGLFMTSQPNVPAASPIPGTTKEVQDIYDLFLKINGTTTRVEKAEGSAITVDQCLENMEQFSSIHLACHASQNAADPLQSRFFLHNGSLDLATIIQRNLKNADLAFLSACQTSTGEEKLPDEAVHLAAGMLAAGYRRVVSTMWSIGDQHAPQVSRDFYEYLWSTNSPDDESENGFDGTNSARAIHHATQELRHRLDDTEESLLAWISYVHFGY